MLRVRRRIVEPFLDDEYDYSVIDSPPSLGPLSDASLIAARNVVVPLLMSEPSVSGFERMWEHPDGEVPAGDGADGEYDGHHPEGEPAYGVGHGEKQVAITAPIPAATSRGT